MWQSLDICGCYIYFIIYPQLTSSGYCALHMFFYILLGTVLLFRTKASLLCCAKGWDRVGGLCRNPKRKGWVVMGNMKKKQKKQKKNLVVEKLSLWIMKKVFQLFNCWVFGRSWQFVLLSLISSCFVFFFHVFFEHPFSRLIEFKRWRNYNRSCQSVRQKSETLLCRGMEK